MVSRKIESPIHASPLAVSNRGLHNVTGNHLCFIMMMFNATVLKSMIFVNRFPSSRNVITRFYSGQRNRMQEFTVLEQPAPGNPFHLAIPVHDMVAAREVNKVAGSQIFL